jgi:hypothetical protein
VEWGRLSTAGHLLRVTPSNNGRGSQRTPPFLRLERKIS